MIVRCGYPDPPHFPTQSLNRLTSRRCLAKSPDLLIPKFMPRPVTLFTGQWADPPLAKLLPLVKKMGYDGVELSCWGDHFEVDRALSEPDYLKKKWALLAKHGLTCHAISNHLVGQAVCDLIDERHKAILPADVWG